MKTADNDNSDTWQTVGAVAAKNFLQTDSRKLFVQSTMSREVSFGCCGSRLEAAEIDDPTLFSDSSFPGSVTFISKDADEARLRQFRKTLIGLVLQRCSLAQISEPIIKRIAINVIDKIQREIAVHIEPNDSVSRIHLSVDHDLDRGAPPAAPAILRSSDFPNEVLSSWRSSAPAQMAGRGLINKELVNSILSERHVDLSTQKNDGRSDMRPEDQRKREDAEEKKGDASRSKFSNVMVGPNAA